MLYVYGILILDHEEDFFLHLYWQHSSREDGRQHQRVIFDSLLHQHLESGLRNYWRSAGAEFFIYGFWS